jgi:hypothetical protein
MKTSFTLQIVPDVCQSCNQPFDRVITPLERELNITLNANNYCEHCMSIIMEQLQQAYKFNTHTN